MSAPSSFDSNLFVRSGQILLVGCFGYDLVIRTLRGQGSLSSSFERLALGFVVISFYASGMTGLARFSDAVTHSLERIADDRKLLDLILEGLKRAAEDPSGASFGPNLPSLFEQAWRTGVWGVMTSLVEAIFLMVGFVLESAQEVLWELLRLFFPLAGGLIPLTPRLAHGLMTWSIELALWKPVLLVVQGVAGVVGARALNREGSWGSSLIAVELVAIILILGIPAFTHRLVSGVHAGDHDAQAKLFVWARAVRSRLPGLNRLGVFAVLLLGVETSRAWASAPADAPIRIYPGFVTKVSCEGKLLISAVGHSRAVRLEALPKELGCGVLLQPQLLDSGLRTNLILETTTGSFERLIEIGSGEPKTQERVQSVRVGGAQ